VARRSLSFPARDKGDIANSLGGGMNPARDQLAQLPRRSPLEAEGLGKGGQFTNRETACLAPGPVRTILASRTPPLWRLSFQDQRSAALTGCRDRPTRRTLSRGRPY
jgi:hypothetical protein